MSRHKWAYTTDLYASEGDACTREGCPCRCRMRKVNVGGRTGHRVEYSNDGREELGTGEAVRWRASLQGEGMSTLERALEIACKAHAGQVDHVGQPIILHVLRVVVACSTPEERIVAALHDVLEDSLDITASDLDAEFGRPITNAVIDLTRRPDEETYLAYIGQLAANPLARSVKIHDLRDNLRPGLPKSSGLYARYREALALLGAAAGGPTK